ncbi:expressed unknown protein [Seminavis robusta]|uniref:Uncharacterized protein n=1 Tax=Seminavis robusta TaxID=568900 RepID=A0A9N8HWF6_9STRA|nr:expressed unknown protein [Seminavis robusta]CAB9529612.1 expressed unknown protein [Seminavis robusta]|eukprot:Sro2202_g318890.1 n/a (114) ;mRNA; f:7000-7443
MPFNPFADFISSGMPSQEELDAKARSRIGEKSVNAQKLQDENFGPDIRAMDPYMRPESRSFNKFQWKMSALKNSEHGIVCSWKAAAAYANTEQATRDAILAKIQAEKEGSTSD